jgi:hypothetical protein
MKVIFKGYIQFVLLSITFVLCSCATGVSQKSQSKESKYSEDLSSYRPKVEKDTASKESVAPTSISKNQPITSAKDVTEAIDAKLSSIAQNAPVSAKGYRVNIYSGTSRDEASIIKKQAELLSGTQVYIQFKTPNFRVKVGDAINRLEANYLLSQLKSDFPAAVVVPDDIVINQKP